MKKGKIVEAGKHRELLEKDGYYADLYKMQFSSDDFSSNFIKK